MTWSAQEQARIFNDYWGNGSSVCPQCKVGFHPKLRSYVGGFAILASCPNGCGNLQMSNSQDPLASTFRDWTNEEIKRVMDDYSAQRVSTCPVDGTSLSIREVPYSDGIMVKALCPRCGQLEHKDFPRL